DTVTKTLRLYESLPPVDSLILSPGASGAPKLELKGGFALRATVRRDLGNGSYSAALPITQTGTNVWQLTGALSSE
ncbi:MAG: hypothetical protein V4543_08610, partial [Bacteroidota bacterium]